MNPIIEMKNVSFNYKSNDGESRGVVDIDLNIIDGEFLVILGHNGSGKSTLAKLLNAFELPDSGEVLVNGISTTNADKIYDIRKTVGMVFQNPDNQMVASIIEDDIAFGCENLGIERSEILKRVDWALKTVNMEAYRAHTPFKLSGGQKQRIAIAAILAMKPSVIIMDESTAMLDPKGRKEVLNVAKELNKKNKMTVILITHYMDEAIDADRVVVMSEGKILKEGTPFDVFSQAEMLKEAKLDLPIPTQVAVKLLKMGHNVGIPLTVDELAEAICQL